MKKATMSTDNPYCHLCSSTGENKRLSSYICDHCQLPMCYICHEKHQGKSIDNTIQIKTSLQNKKQLFITFEEHCVKNINSIFDEIIHDIENLRKESIDYVKQQFRDTEIILSDLMTKHKTDDNLHEFDKYFSKISSPIMQLKISTLPRNKFHLHCQLLSDSKVFSSSYPGKIITSKCSCHQQTEHESEKIDVDTEVEELNQIINNNKQTQTGSINETTTHHHADDDEDEFYSLQEETSELSNRIYTEYCLSTNYHSHGTILTQNEVDRIASDGEHLLYFSGTTKSICYITNIISSNKHTNGISGTKEIICRWPHQPILDLVYSTVSSKFICATKTGVYTCTICSQNNNLTIDIQMQLTQHWSYVRLSTDNDYLWLWTDTPRLSQLSIYSPKTFDCIKTFKLTNYPRFSDNSTSFCIENNLLATVFQYKQTTHNTTSTSKKYFHVTLCDATDLQELYTIRLGECDIDHEIRANKDGKFFITNGKRKLWIIDRNGKKEYVKLSRSGRALTVHRTNQIIIANGSQQLQCVELRQDA